MKKILSIVLAILPLLCLTACKSADQSFQTDAEPVSIQKIDLEGYLPVTTESITSVLKSARRFTISEIKLDTGAVDIYGVLDKNGDEDAARVTFCETDIDHHATDFMLYNFLKSDVLGAKETTIRWGLSVLLSAFEVELTDDIWSAVMEVAQKTGSAGALGTDYDGYADEQAGIRLIYADLGECVQIDIRAYEYQ